MASKVLGGASVLDLGDGGGVVVARQPSPTPIPILGGGRDLPPLLVDPPASMDVGPIIPFGPPGGRSSSYDTGPGATGGPSTGGGPGRTFGGNPSPPQRRGGLSAQQRAALLKYVRAVAARRAAAAAAAALQARRAAILRYVQQRRASGYRGQINLGDDAAASGVDALGPPGGGGGQSTLQSIGSWLSGASSTARDAANAIAPFLALFG